MILDKFLPPFIDFMNEHFDTSNHKFVFMGKPKYKYGLTPEHNVEWIDRKKKVFKLLSYMYNAQKIILHGLWSEHINKILFLQPWLLKKCYWVMWGGDFYFPEKQSWIKKQLIRSIKHFIVSNQKDVEYIKHKYNINPKSIIYSQLYPTCISYVCNENLEIHGKYDSKVKILVGNSATPTNRHKEIFEMLYKYKDENIEIYVPLSYGYENYRDEVMKLGYKQFGSKFIPVAELLSFEEYKQFLQNMDIAIFNHNRQQGGSNIKLLAGFGKKVYISKENSFYHELLNDGIRIYDISEFNLQLIDEKIAINNKKIATEKYSLQALKNSWAKVFTDTKKDCL